MVGAESDAEATRRRLTVLLKCLQDEKKLNVTAAGEAAGRSQSYWSKVMNGTVLPKREQIETFVNAIGYVDPDVRGEILRLADQIFLEELHSSGQYDVTWQAFTVLLPISSVGVMGDERTYENVCAVRAVTSTDGMTADWARIPYEVLATVSNRIINEVRGINRIVYDISSKPPATIEWE